MRAVLYTVLFLGFEVVAFALFALHDAQLKWCEGVISLMEPLAQANEFADHVELAQDLLACAYRMTKPVTLRGNRMWLS